MSEQLNNFFENATPAQINQLHASGPKQQATPQHHPQIQAEMPTMVDDLPQVEYTEPAAEPVYEQETQAAPAPQQQAPVEHEESPQQLRFREVREGKLKAEWERDQMARRLQEYEERQARPQTQPEPEDDYGIAPDALLEGKDIAKIIKTVEQRAEKKYRVQQQVVMQNVTENRLKMELPDLEQVVNDDNIRMLRQMYPEIAQSINANPDFYSKAKAAYTMIKRLNIAPEAPQQPSYDYEADRRRIQQNAAKPRPVQTVVNRQSPLAASNAYDGELTDGIKSQYWKEMQKAMKG